MVKSFKAIKNMNPKVWANLKADAAKHDLTMPEFLKILLDEHRKREHVREHFDELKELVQKHARPILREAEKIKEEISVEHRRGFG